MASPLRFNDHTAFHLQVLRMTVASAAFGLATYLVGLMVSTNGRVAHALLLAAAATVLGLAGLPPRRKAVIPAVLLGLGVGLLGALAMQALSHSKPGYPWFGVGVYGLAVGIIAGRDLRGARRFILPLATGVTVALATWVEATFRTGVHVAAYVPSFLAEPIYGGVFGFLVSTALVARQVTWHQDPVTKAFEEVRPHLSGEMLELSDQAVTLYVKIQKVLKDRKDQGNETEPALAQAVERLVLRVFAMGRQWQEVEQGTGRTNADELTARIDALEAKIEQTSDAVARKQYRQAREALGTQLKYLREISRNRERVTARVHNYLATLERLQMALWNLRGADAAKLSDEVQPIIDEIQDVGLEMDFASEALDEVGHASEVETSVADAPEAEPEQAEEPAAEEPAEAPRLEAAAETVEPAEEAAEEQPEDDGDAETELSARAFD
jgi:hypothetical protein